MLRRVAGLDDGGDDVLLVGRELQAGDGLPRLQGERLARILQLLLRLRSLRGGRRGRGLTSSSSFCCFLSYSWLSVPRGGSPAAAGDAAAALSLSAPPPSRHCRRAVAGGGGERADVGHLHERAVFQRQDVEVAGAGERDAFAVRREIAGWLGIGGPGELARLAGGVVVNEEIAVAARRR